MTDSGNTGPSVDQNGEGAEPHEAEEPSLQKHHDPETEEDTSSGGPAD